MNTSTIMQVHCEEEDCGMVSAYEMWADGSFRRILNACWHTKRMPTKQNIMAQIDRDNRKATK